MAHHGHLFAKKTFHKPTFCHHCTDMLWGLIQQGHICEVCNFVVHERCLKTVVTPCSTVAMNHVKTPVAHCWSEPGHFKRKFCQVCRKRLDDSFAVKCEICDYFVHSDCVELSVPNCKECATYFPGRELSSVRHIHHWREGNLPSSSKCVVCRKACFSGECLAGYKCEWCGITAHAGCYKSASPECNFGVLEPIYLPPHAVSIPRTEVPMETIIGVASKNKLREAAMSREMSCLAEDQVSESDMAAEAAEFSDDRLRLMATSDELRTSANSYATLVVDSILKGSEYAERLRRAVNEVLFPSSSGARSISEEFSSGDRDSKPAPSKGDSESETPTGAGATSTSTTSKSHDKEKDEETIKVYDGNQGIRRRQFRPIHVSKYATLNQLLSSALRAFHIIKQTENYYLTDAYDEEAPIADPNPVLNLKRREGKRPAVFLRFREGETSGEVQVHSGRLKTAQSNATIPVTDDTTVVQVIEAALDQFGLDPVNAANYRMLKLTLDKGGVAERVLDRDDKPWLMLKEHARDSVRQMENVRFHLQLAEDPHGPTVALYVGNLPTNMNQRQYEHVLQDFLGREKANKFTFGPIYYEYGSLVILYEDANEAVRAYYALRESVYDDKSVLVLLLPALGPHLIPANVTPLLVFVNVKSGGCQGLELVTSFRKLLNPYQVFDLDNGGPLPGLYVFRHIKNYRILVCGGDGTIGWVLQCLDNVGQDSVCSSPPAAIVPLGTGNDLARVLRWGPGYTGGEDAMTLLKDVIEAEEITLDRWTVVFHPDEKADDKIVVNQALQIGSGQSEDNTAIYVMNNYFGIGIDADLCLDFHNAREENPKKFNSRFHNKGVYVKVGLRKMVSKNICRNLQNDIRLEVDGKHVELPPVEGIIILNILSWGSGANPWGPEREDQFSKPNHWDGMLEVVGVTGVVHLGQIQSGLRSAMRIAQGGHIKIRMNAETPVQVDGEPWIQTPGDVVVLKSALKATMLKKTKIKRRNTEAVMSPMATSCPSPTPPTSTHQESTDE